MPRVIEEVGTHLNITRYFFQTWPKQFGVSQPGLLISPSSLTLHPLSWCLFSLSELARLSCPQKRNSSISSLSWKPHTLLTLLSTTTYLNYFYLGSLCSNRINRRQPCNFILEGLTFLLLSTSFSSLQRYTIPKQSPLFPPSSTFS